MRILIVDDHQIVRHGVRRLLEAEKDFEICGEAVDGRDAIKQAGQLKPDAIVMDVSMPNLNGIEATREIRHLLPESHIVILSQHDSIEMMRQALNAGAHAYVVKSAIATDLVAALDKIQDNGEPSVPEVFGSTHVNVDVHEILQRSAAFEEALRQSEERLRREVADLKLLQRISTELIQEESISNLYEKIADAAVAVMHSDFASMQMLYPERGKTGELLLLAFRGFTAEAARFWEWVPADSGSTCAAALRTGERVIVSDIENCDFMAGTEDLRIYRQTGIRAVQSTPLLSRIGQIVGMISTHWRGQHRPSERDLRIFDVLARQAADLIEWRRTAEAALEKEQQLRVLAARLDDRVIDVQNVGPHTQSLKKSKRRKTGPSRPS